MNKPQYQPKQGEESYVHVRVTKKNGQVLAEPLIDLYDPTAVAGIFKLNGFEGEIIHDPRTSAQKSTTVASNTVKAQQTLETDEQYRARYTELFKQEVPFNITLDEVRRAVDAAEAKLPQILAGATLVQEPVFLQDTATLETATAQELNLSAPTVHDGPTEEDAPSAVAPAVVKGKGGK